MLGQIKEFARYRQSMTDNLLKELSDVLTSDVAIFRRLLKSTAAVERGRWLLTGKTFCLHPVDFFFLKSFAP